MKAIDANMTFTPGQEIMEPDRFAGRRVNIGHAIKVLSRPGTSMLVYGDRGVGKSSFVEMVKLIAQDQVELIYRYGFRRLVPASGFQYKVVSIQCDADTDSSEKVLQRLITSPEGFASFISARINTIQKTKREKLGMSLLRGLFAFDTIEEQKVVLEEFKEESIVELFTNIVQSVTNHILSPNEGLLIVIDEFDKVTKKEKISSLIKTLSKGKVKFLISGIAESYFDLVDDHPSIERQLYQGKIEIQPMTAEDIAMLFEIAEGHNDGLVTFNKSFIDDVVAKSFGYPYYVQLFGQLALDEYVDLHGKDVKGTITRDYFERALRKFALHEPQFERLYLSVVSNDPYRELMLKGLANDISRRIRQDQVFRYCSKRGMENPKNVLAQILSHKQPEVLIRMDRDTVTFKDSLFRIYAGSRNPDLLEMDEFIGLKIKSG